MFTDSTGNDDHGPPPPEVELGEMAVTVRPGYAAEHSDPQARRYIFLYNIRIENVGSETAQLFWRHWFIHDPSDHDQEVEGAGVVGQSPVLAPGDVHSYQSFCVLRGPVGHMEGYYHFRRRDGSVFRAPIPRFHFRAPPEGSGPLLN